MLCKITGKSGQIFIVIGCRSSVTHNIRSIRHYHKPEDPIYHFSFSHPPNAQNKIKTTDNHQINKARLMKG